MIVLRVAIGKDLLKWHDKFAEAFETIKLNGYPLEYSIVNMERHDWINKIKSFDLLIWKPLYMGPRSSGFFKEKIYFIEKYLHKIVIPNYETVWHFESKIAQSYLFELNGIPHPHTIASFDFNDAKQQAKKVGFPIVFKRSYGASGDNVWLVKNEKEVNIILKKQFYQELWDSSKSKYSSKIKWLMYNLTKTWFWTKIKQKILNDERIGFTYFQKFIHSNKSDLRITVIGDRYAYAFWRNNRKNDFRASGSGRLDFEREIPEEIIKYCMKVNNRMKFDSMAYDILFDENKFVITEISYGYLDSVPNQSARYFYLQNNQIKRKDQKIWPQQLWAEWAIKKAEKYYSRKKKKDTLLN
jgi:glutathione synthase/RimK-type ligase-like ATP-grasp enzyme